VIGDSSLRLEVRPTLADGRDFPIVEGSRLDTTGASDESFATLFPGRGPLLWEPRKAVGDSALRESFFTTAGLILTIYSAASALVGKDLRMRLPSVLIASACHSLLRRFIGIDDTHLSLDRFTPMITALSHRSSKGNQVLRVRG